MVQPGLLGSLNAFGREYGRIIETRADTAPQKLEALRYLIEPQVIRRLKKDVATNLRKRSRLIATLRCQTNSERCMLVR